MRRAALAALTLTAFLSTSGFASAAATRPFAPAAATSPALSQRPVNQREDRAALSAYASYLDALLTNKPAERLQEQVFAAAIANSCKHALEPIATVSSVPSGWSTALTNIGTEIGADATVEFADATQASFDKLATALGALKWASASANATVKRFLAAQATFVLLQPSNLCGDALDVASETNLQTIASPPGTLDFLGQYDTDSSSVNLRLNAFLKLLGAWETSSEQDLVIKIDSLARKVNVLTTTTIANGTTELKAALGIPSLTGNQPKVLSR